MTERIRILFLIPTLAAGGAERVITTIVKNLDRSKFEIALGVLDLREAFFLHEIPKDVELIDLKARRVRYAFISVTRLIWRRRPDIVFSTLGHLNLALGMLRPMLPGRCTYIAREAANPTESWSDQKYYRTISWAYRKFYPKFHRIVAQSRYMRDDLSRNYDIPLEKISVIPNPLDITGVRAAATQPVEPIAIWNGAPNDGTIRVLAVGRLSPQKGYDLLIDAIALSGLKQLRVAVIGNGELRCELEALARIRGVGSQIEFVGFRKNPYAYMAQADVFILPSRFEGLPNVVLEALACGAPVIATPMQCGLLDIAAATPGIRLARDISASALAAELESFVRSYGEPSPAPTLDRFSLSRVISDYESLFLSPLDMSVKTARGNNILGIEGHL